MFVFQRPSWVWKKKGPNNNYYKETIVFNYTHTHTHARTHAHAHACAMTKTPIVKHNDCDDNNIINSSFAGFSH